MVCIFSLYGTKHSSKHPCAMRKKRLRSEASKHYPAKTENSSELEIWCAYARLIVTFIQKPYWWKYHMHYAGPRTVKAFNFCVVLHYWKICWLKREQQMPWLWRWWGVATCKTSTAFLPLKPLGYVWFEVKQECIGISMSKWMGIFFFFVWLDERDGPVFFSGRWLGSG
jgi:hypothetical protein